MPTYRLSARNVSHDFRTPRFQLLCERCGAVVGEVDPDNGALGPGRSAADMRRFFPGQAGSIDGHEAGCPGE